MAYSAFFGFHTSIYAGSETIFEPFNPSQRCVLCLCNGTTYQTLHLHLLDEETCESGS